MDVINAIARDHREIMETIDEVGGSAADREFGLAQTRLRIAAHHTAKQVHVFPELERAGPEAGAMVDDRRRAHREVETGLAHVTAAIGTPDYDLAMARFTDLLDRQITREETALFPALQAALTPERLEELGHKFDLRRLAELEAGIGQQRRSTEPPS